MGLINITVKEKRIKSNDTRIGNVNSLTSKDSSGVVRSKANLNKKNANIIDKKQKTGTNANLKTSLLASYIGSRAFSFYRSVREERSNPYVSVEVSLAQKAALEAAQTTGSVIGGAVGGFLGGAIAAGIFIIITGGAGAIVIGIGSAIGGFFGGLFGGKKGSEGISEEQREQNAKLQFRFTQFNKAFARKLKGVRPVIS